MENIQTTMNGHNRFMTMKTHNTLPVIAKIVDKPGFQGNKYDVASMAYCHPKTAARILCSMWMENILYIKGWTRIKGSAIPIYARRKNGEQDAEKPKPLSAKERNDKYLSKPETQLAKRQRAKLYRYTKKVLSGTVRIGIWGL